MSWAAGWGGDVYVQDIEWGASDGDGYALDLEVLVGGVGGESSEADGVVDEEGETARSARSAFVVVYALQKQINLAFRVHAPFQSHIKKPFG